MKQSTRFVWRKLVFLDLQQGNAEKNDTAGYNKTVSLLWVLESTWTRVCKICVFSRKLEAIQIRKMTKRSHGFNKKRISLMCALLIFSSCSFSYKFENLLSYFLESIWRISSNFKWYIFGKCQKSVGILCCYW